MASVNFSNIFLFISRLSLAISICFASLSRKSFFEFFTFFARYPSLGRLIVTTPTEPVRAFAPKSPPPRLSSSPRSSRRRQHIDLVSSGFISEFMKLLKYGMPYFAVISQRPLRFSSFQSKSFVILTVGIGKVKTLPWESPSAITSKNALLNIYISFWKSEYFSF